MILKLTDDNGRHDILVNINNMLTVEFRQTGSTLVFPNGDRLKVIQSLSEIEELIKEAK